MKLHNNETVFDNLNTPKRHYPMSSRILSLALIAISCLMIVFGLFIDRLPESNTTNLFYLISCIPVTLFIIVQLFYLFLRKSDPELRIASRWALKSIAGLDEESDERERQIIDQAYRTSYRIIELGFAVAFAILFVTEGWYRPYYTYHPGPIGIFLIMFGILSLMSFLPTAIVVWNKEV
jgi:hypothetical protein